MTPEEIIEYCKGFPNKEFIVFDAAQGDNRTSVNYVKVCWIMSTLVQTEWTWDLKRIINQLPTRRVDITSIETWQLYPANQYRILTDTEIALALL